MEELGNDSFEFQSEKGNKKKLNQTEPNKFETYMQVKMVNPEYKEVYKEMKNNE